MDYSRTSLSNSLADDAIGGQPPQTFASMMMKGKINGGNQRETSISTFPSTASTATGGTYSTDVTTAMNNLASVSAKDTRRMHNDNAISGGYVSLSQNHSQNHLDGPQLYRRNSESSTTSSNNSQPKSKTQSTIPPRPAAKKAPNKKKNPLRVLGIALIVDQMGKGARMLARYPTSQSSLKKVDDDDDDDNDDHRHASPIVEDDDDDDDDHDDDDGIGDDRRSKAKDDLFFTLTARQMAKLFRTKRSLCNQPMTLRVNKTIFCCHAVLLDDGHHSKSSAEESSSHGNEDSKKGADSSRSAKGREKDGRLSPLPSSIRKDGSSGYLSNRDRDTASVSSSLHPSETGEDEDTNTNELKLFSVVVALEASTQHVALPFSSFWASGNGNAGGEDRSDLERYLRYGGIKEKEGDEIPNARRKSSEGKLVNGDEKNVNTKKRWKLNKKRQQTAARLSSIFLAIRRVHISLIRFCRALEREENRCAYVTLQSRALFKIRSERQKEWEAMYNNFRMSSSSASVSNPPNPNASSAGSSGDRSPLHSRHPVVPRHSRHNSFASTPGGSSLLSDTSLKKVLDNTDVTGEVVRTVEEEQEKEQEILELMLACNPQREDHGYSLPVPESSQGEVPPFPQKQYGNLIRDLVAVFHSLSRNDQEYPPTPSSLLCERDAVVYVNNHFAIPIDAAGLSGTSGSTSFAPAGISSPFQNQKHGFLHLAEGVPVVVPYYTLLFPHASPSELLHTFHASGSAPPQQLEHLLLTVNPQKPLTQIAIDANLPMHTTVQMASFLVRHGACISSPVVTSRSRLTCLGNESMQRIPELALEFSQAFPGVSLFGVVSFLTTSSRHLGDAMAVLVDTSDDEASWLRDSLLASPKYRYHNSNHRLRRGVARLGSGEVSDKPAESGGIFHDDAGVYSPTQEGRKGPSSSLSVHEYLKEIEEALYAIAIWLLSHGVLIQLQEYMVAVEVEESSQSSSSRLVNATMDSGGESSSSLIVPSQPMATSTTTTGTETSKNRALSLAAANNSTTKHDWDENLFEELMAMDYLNGDVSIMALSWRLAIDPRKLRRWGLRHKRVRVISRVPAYGDDWEPPSGTTNLSQLGTTNATTSASSSTDILPPAPLL